MCVRACVCVCVGNPNYNGTSASGREHVSTNVAGECGMTVGPHSTKLPQSWDTESDQLGVPASK